MAYSTGLLKHRVTILNRTEAQTSKWGKDGTGVSWRNDGTVWASVEWARGKGGMNAGALDVYSVVIVRMRYNTIVNERSRILYEGKTYQIIGEMFHTDRQENTIQFNAQVLTNDR